MPLPRDFQPALLWNTYVCSGHGIWDPKDGKFHLPGNVTVLFWVHHGDALTNGVALEELILGFDENELGSKGYNKDPKKLTTPAQLMSFEAKPTTPTATAVSRPAVSDRRSPAIRPTDSPPVRPKPRSDLPEVILPNQVCYNYQLEYDSTISMFVSFSKIRLLEKMRDFDLNPPYPESNIITIKPFSASRTLRDIISTINENTSEPIQLHWSACRSCLV